MNYATILKGKYPAKAHARRVVDLIRQQKPDADGVLYLEGRMTKLLEDNDEPEPFRQRRYFYYLSGCPLADCYLMHEIAADKTTLFIPPIDPESVIWSGLPVTAEEARAVYDVDEVRYTTDVNPTLAHVGASVSSAANGRPSTAFAIASQVSPSITLLGFDKVDFYLLKDAIDRCRVVKDEYEVAMIEKANAISTGAHHAAMQRARHVTNETELEAVILGHCVARGAKQQAYHSILASGRAAATLHYVQNDQPMPEGKQNVLVDAGCEWDCYAADITRTFPISGKFTPESRAIYDTVLRMQTECINMLKEGVQWETVHLHAHRVLIEGLLGHKILRGGTVDEILEKRTSVAFLPHGLGHYLGMDTHDTGGNPNYEDKDPIFRYLRVRGTLPAGAVITVEPGIYFCRFIIEPYLKDPDHAKFIDESVLERFWDVGGVRIEDNILITKDGFRNLTPAIKDPAELEKMILSSTA